MDQQNTQNTDDQNTQNMAEQDVQEQNNTQNVEEENTQNAGQENTQNAGEENTQNAGEENTQNAGQENTQNAGEENTQNGGEENTQNGGEENTQNTEEQNAPTMEQQNSVSAEEQPPKTLYEAVKGNNCEMVESLLSSGEDVNLRGMDGKTLLHLAVNVNADLSVFKALLDKMDDFYQRDENGDTVLEAIFATDYSQEAEDAIRDRLRKLVAEGDLEKIKNLVMSGWTYCLDKPEEFPESSQETADFLKTIPELKEKINKIHGVVKNGEIGVVQQLQEDKELLRGCDRTGLPPLTKALVLGKYDLVKEMVKEFPESLNFKDNLGKVPLHYAAVAEDGGEMYDLFLGAGAEDTPDNLGKLAKDYKENPELLNFSKTQERVLKILEAPGVCERVKKQNILQDDVEIQAEQASEAQKESSEKVDTDDDNASEQQQENVFENQSVEPKEDTNVPTSYEGRYLASVLGEALTKALAEISECRPWDPIEYLAHYLYKYHADIAYSQHQKELKAEIQAEEEEKQNELILKEKRKEEQRQIREEEARKRKEEEEEAERQRLELEEQQIKAKEALLSQPPDLPTVKEETGEVEANLKEKDENGQTELHRLAAIEDADLMNLLNQGYSLADRDAQYKTPRDIAEENNLDKNVEVFDSYLTDLIEGEKLDTLQQLILEGYDKFSSVLDKVSTDGLPETVTSFINDIPELQTKIKDLIKASRSGVVRDVSQLLTRKALVLAKDNMGRTPLHNAVLYSHEEVAAYLAENYPVSVRARDTLNRTPVHYAAGLSEEIYQMFIENGGDLTIKDARGKTPSDYVENKEEIIALRDEAPGIEVTAPDNDDNEHKDAMDGDNAEDEPSEDTENSADNAAEETQEQES